jgi:hypothetical protein
MRRRARTRKRTEGITEGSMMDWHKAGEEREKKGRRGKIEVYYLVLLVGFFPVFLLYFF